MECPEARLSSLVHAVSLCKNHRVELDDGPEAGVEVPDAGQIEFSQPPRRELLLGEGQVDAFDGGLVYVELRMHGAAADQQQKRQPSK